MKVGRENFTDMLTRSLQNKEQSQIDTARSPATNKENDNMQASNSKDERVTDVSLSGFGGQVSRDNAILNTPGVNSTLLPLSFSNQDSSSSMVEQHLGGRAPGNETAAGVSVLSMDEERSRNEEKWELSDGTTNFKSDREPVGLVIPENFTVRKTFDQGEYVEVRFLASCDMASLGQCEGQGGASVARAVLKFLQMDSPTSVSLDNLKVRMHVQLRANALEKYMVAVDSRTKIKARFHQNLAQEGWKLKSFEYDERFKCLNMEYEPPLVY